MAITSFKQLKVWQVAHQVALAIYRQTQSFPADERFGLTHQMRKSAVSIPSNIAEGFGRRSGKDRARFFTIAKGSTEELRYYLELAKDLGYLSAIAVMDCSLDEIGAMLYKLWQLEMEKGRQL